MRLNNLFLLVAFTIPTVGYALDKAVADHIVYSITSTGNHLVEVSELADTFSNDQLVIPSQITIENETYYVTGIGAQAFAKQKSLRNINIEANLEYIDSQAFLNCLSLRHINLPSSLLYLGDACFQNCSSLQSIVIPESIDNMGKYLFYGCTSLESATIMTAVSTLEAFTFYNCTSLKDVHLPSSVSAVDECCFYGCKSLVSYPEKSVLFTIGENAFHNCQSLSTLPISTITEKIGNNAFEGCTGVSLLDLSEISAEFGKSVFAGCTSLERVILPSNLSGIAPSMFADCVTLSEINFPTSLQTIGEYAFANCRILSEIVLPENLTLIGRDAFSGAGIENITFENTNTAIDKGAFENNTSLKNLILKGITEIGERAFSNCTSLEVIEMDHDVKSIGSMAFENCPSLLRVYMRTPVPPSITINTFSDYTEKYGTLYVMPGYRRAYALATYWERFLNIREEDNFISDVANSTLDSTDIKINANQVDISGYEGHLNIVSITGQVIYSVHCNGDMSVTLSPGVYILSTENAKHKFII